MRRKKSRKKQIAFRTMREYRDHYYREKTEEGSQSGDKYYRLGVQSASLAMTEVKRPS